MERSGNDKYPQVGLNVCPICQGKDCVLFFHSKDYRYRTSRKIFTIVRCKGCDFLYLNPALPEEEQLCYYPDKFHYQPGSLLNLAIKPLFDKCIELHINEIKKRSKGRRILDVGCGGGYFLSRMQESGFEVFGVEPNARAFGHAVSAVGSKIRYSDLASASFPDKYFDLIIAFNSLEHMYKINENIAEMRRVLKDDGILYIVVPDSDYFEARLFKGYYFNLEAPRHLSFFTRKSIRDLFLRHGFVPEFIDEKPYEYISTPASIGHSLCYLLQDKGIYLKGALESALIAPFVFLRLFLRFALFFNQQNIKVFFRK